MDEAGGTSYAWGNSRLSTEGYAISPHAPVIDVGDQAPGFTLRHTFDRDVGLHERLAQGPVVLCFYVFDFGNL